MYKEVNSITCARHCDSAKKKNTPNSSSESVSLKKKTLISRAFNKRFLSSSRKLSKNSPNFKRSKREEEEEGAVG